jgi:CHAT domain-containing protein
LRRENEPPAPQTIAVLADPVFDKDDPRVGTHRAVIDATKADVSQSEGDFYLSRAMEVIDGGASIPRLPATAHEARAVRNLVPAGEALIATDFDASRARALSEELTRYRIVHFATHAILNDEHPELSGIVLSLVDERGDPRSGFLRLHDIYNLNLPADLVVLSACRTGLGRNVPGEGLVGLTRGFMYAGAKSVVASLWKVDDKATSELMGHFYRALLKEGKTPASALRAAKREMLKHQEYRAPYFWAAFILQGEYRERFVSAEGKATRYTPLVAIAAAALLASGVYILLRARRRRARG